MKNKTTQKKKKSVIQWEYKPGYRKEKTGMQFKEGKQSQKA